MRALVRVLPLLVVAAQVAACAADTVAGGDPGAAHYAAAASPSQPAVKRAVRDAPSQALLARQPSPRCELSKPLGGVPPEQARAAMLDYEQQCYRQRADIVHAQLAALQDAAAKMRAFGSAHRTLLERQPPPHCEPAKPAAGLGAVEAHEATLDADRQCYKQIEASERQKLAALQDAVRNSSDGVRSQRGNVRPAQRQRYVTY
jgi:hypothetical protein